MFTWRQQLVSLRALRYLDNPTFIRLIVYRWNFTYVQGWPFQLTYIYFPLLLMNSENIQMHPCSFFCVIIEDVFRNQLSILATCTKISTNLFSSVTQYSEISGLPEPDWSQTSNAWGILKHKTIPPVDFLNHLWRFFPTAKIIYELQKTILGFFNGFYFLFWVLGLNWQSHY